MDINRVITEEIWKDIPDFVGFYQISTNGTIRGVERIVKHSRGGNKKIKEKIIKTQTIWSGYERVCLCKNNIKKIFSIHRLVLKTFSPHSDQDNMQVNHKNGIRCDNRLENLEWCTSSENNKHAFNVLKRKPTKFWSGVYGASNPSSIPIIQKDLKGNFIARYDSSASAARQLNLNKSHISNAAKKRRKTAYNFIWERVTV